MNMNNEETIFLSLASIGSRFRNRVKIPTRHRGNPGTEISGYDILPGYATLLPRNLRVRAGSGSREAESPSLNELPQI